LSDVSTAYNCILATNCCMRDALGELVMAVARMGRSMVSSVVVNGLDRLNHHILCMPLSFHDEVWCAAASLLSSEASWWSVRTW
jgi:hypothetical protein